MAFNRKAKLRDNIEAIRTAFELDGARRAATPQERERLTRYCGFGGLKCILNPASDLTDAVRWAKSDLELFPLTLELHKLIREYSTSEALYKQYVDSLKSSVLTAFYTPPTITEALSDVLDDYNVRPRRLLEPAAGHGAFVEAFTRKNADADVMAFEKDLLTGKILAHLYPDKNVRTEGFERIEKPFNDYFDAAVSNIPFGDVAVFDLVTAGERIVEDAPFQLVDQLVAAIVREGFHVVEVHSAVTVERGRKSLFGRIDVRRLVHGERYGMIENVGFDELSVLRSFEGENVAPRSVHHQEFDVRFGVQIPVTGDEVVVTNIKVVATIR